MPVTCDRLGMFVQVSFSVRCHFIHAGVILKMLKSKPVALLTPSNIAFRFTRGVGGAWNISSAYTVAFS